MVFLTDQFMLPSQLTMVQLGEAIVVIAILAILLRLTLSGTRRALARTPAHANARLLLNRIIQFTFLAVGVFLVLGVLGVEITALAALLGLVGIAVSLALQDLLKNLVAGLYILIERPFTIGEHIDFRTFTGTVETTGLRTTVLRTVSGSRAVIPNALLFAEPLVNRSAYGSQLVRLRVAVKVAAGDASADQVAAAGALADGAAQPEPAPSAATDSRSADPSVPEVGRPPGEPAGRGTQGPTTQPSVQAHGGAEPAPRFADELLSAIAAAGGSAGAADTPPAVLVESLTEQKVTLRAEFWAADARTAACQVAWAVRERLPAAEITVLE